MAIGQSGRSGGFDRWRPRAGGSPVSGRATRGSCRTGGDWDAGGLGQACVPRPQRFETGNTRMLDVAGGERREHLKLLVTIEAMYAGKRLIHDDTRTTT
jgi:hypothetical protein